MHEEIGLNFAAALRAFLRQDPDIIMVGEIRDFETAEIGVKAALTGHLVLSTLHTNDAPSTVNRLLNMGIEPFLVASSVNLILAQRLARVICAALQGGVADRARGADRDRHAAGATRAVTLLCAAPAARPAAAPATRAASRSTRSCRMADALAELVLAGASGAELKRAAIARGHEDAAAERPQQDRRGHDDASRRSCASRWPTERLASGVRDGTGARDAGAQLAGRTQRRRGMSLLPACRGGRHGQHPSLPAAR